MEKFSKFLRELRKEKGLNQEQLANALFVHRTTVVKWETGVAVPLNDTLILLSDYFDVSVDELLNGKRNDTGVDTSNTNKVLRELIRSRSKQTKMLFASSVVIVLLVIVFLIYYFFTTFGSVHVYRLFGDNGNISMRDGLLISTNDNVYFRPGNFFKSDSLELVDDISRLKIFYYDNEVKVYLIDVGYDELLVEYALSSIEFKRILNKEELLYLEVIYANGVKEKIELEYYEDFENDKKVSKEDDMIKTELDVDDTLDEKVNFLVKNGFKYDEKSKGYILNKNKIDYMYYNDSIQIIEKDAIFINMDLNLNVLIYVENELGVIKKEKIINYCSDKNNDFYKMIYNKYLSRYFKGFIVCD